MGNDTADKETPDDKAKKAIASIVKGSEGVDTWENVTYKIDDNNNLIFKGTAYFKSFNDMQIGSSVKSDKRNLLKIDKDSMTLTWAKETGDASVEKTEPPKLSEKELAAAVNMTQAQMRQSAAMMGAMLKGFKNESVYHLPGKIQKINNFKKINDNTVSMSIDGEKIMAVMNEFANDKKAITDAVKKGRNIQQDGPEDDFMNKKMFGQTGPVSVTVTGLKPIFDYSKAVKAAEKKYPAMCKELGIDKIEPPVKMKPF